MNLPQIFVEQMKEILGPELPEYLESYEKPKFTGLRVNTSKISVEEFERLAHSRLFGEYHGLPMDIIIQKRMRRQSILITMQVFIIFRSQVP